MYGSPDDMSCVSQEAFSDVPATISDSDLVRDREAKHVRWHPFPYLPDTAVTSVHSRSKDTLIEADVSSSKSGRGMRSVKAKI